jgi:hypothetical protein
MEDIDILKLLQKKYGNVIYFQSQPVFGKPNEFYFFNLEIFKGPMWVFHLLRKTGLFLDKVATVPRKIIYKHVEEKFNIELDIKHVK